MRFNLSSVRVEFEAQSCLYKWLGDVNPIQIGESKVVSIVVTDRSIEFPTNLDFLEMVDLDGQSVCEISELLA